MKFPVALYVLASATGAIALPAQEDRSAMQVRAAGEANIVDRSAGHEHSRAVEVQSRAETAQDDDELIVVINDPESPTKGQLQSRINTQSANNVGYGKAIAAAVDAAYTQAKQISNWDEVSSPHDIPELSFRGAAKVLTIQQRIPTGASRIHQEHGVGHGFAEPGLQQGQGGRLLQPRLPHPRCFQLLWTEIHLLLQRPAQDRVS